MKNTSTITLDELVAAAGATTEVRRRARPEADLRARLADRVLPEGGRLRDALRGPSIAIIAEVKAASPLSGPLRPTDDSEDFDSVFIATGYQSAGAVAVSVLTEEHYFDGSLDDLRAVSAAVEVPTLRKDFIVDTYQVHEAALAGAGALLLIANVLSAGQLADLVGTAHDLGLDALVEVHGYRSLTAAVECGSGLIGINNRDLRTMRVDVEHSIAIAPDLPADILRVAESGIASPSTLIRLHQVGYQGALIGSAFMRADDPGAVLAEWLADLAAEAEADGETS